METEVINNSAKNGKKDKNGNVMKNVAVAGAAAVAGAGSVLGAEAVLGHGVIPEAEVETEGKIENGATEATQQNEQTTPTTDNNNSTTQTTQGGSTSSQHTPSTNDPQPQDTHNTQHNNSQNGGQGNSGGQGNEESVISDVNPDDVAQEIVEGEYIDPTDIDSGDLAITGVGTIQTLDGQVLNAAQISAEDDSIYVVDLNNDGVYDVYSTEEGELLGFVEETLTVDDAETICTQSEPEYLGMTETSATDNLDADIMNNITNLDA